MNTSRFEIPSTALVLNRELRAPASWSAVGEGGGAHTALAFTANSIHDTRPIQSGVSPVPRQSPHSKTFWRSERITTGAHICLLLAFLLSASFVHAQQYSIDWHTIDGGGGTSTGGVYAVTGTIGQPDAGVPLTGGNYALTGGFWSLLSVVQTAGAPTLTISLTTSNTALVSWPSPSTGFNLQVNTNGLGTVNWSNAPAATDNGTVKYLIVNPPTGNRFYRLFKP